MSTKRRGVPSYEKASLDEPIFVLRAQDILAPDAVRRWAKLAESYGVSHAKIREAMDCAKQMEDWKKRKVPD